MIASRTPAMSLSDAFDLCTVMNSFTGDMNYLNHQYLRVPVFLYGQEKIGLRHSQIVRGEKLVGRAWTERKEFFLAICGKNNNPVLFDTNRHDKKDPLPQERVEGELYAVRPHVIAALDSHHENGRVFKRTYRFFYYTNQRGVVPREKMSIGGAYVYLGISDYWKSQKNLREAGMASSPEFIDPWYYYDRRDEQGI